MRKAIVLLTIVMMVQPGWSQTPTQSTQDWPSAASLRLGASMIVERRNGPKLKGNLSSLSAERVSIKSGGSVTEINRGDVQRISRTSGSIRNSVLLGAGAGAGSGAILGAVTYRSQHGFNIVGKETAVLGGALIGTAAGAAVGWVIGLARHKEVVVFRAP